MFPSYLNAVFKGIAWQREAFFLLQWFAEDDELLKQEDPPLPGSGQKTTFLLTDGESILLEQFPLSCDLPLKHVIVQHLNNTSTYFIKFYTTQ